MTIPLTIIYLPPGLELGTKLEIISAYPTKGAHFSYTAQDIRLSYPTVNPSQSILMRLAGLYADTLIPQNG